MKKILAAAFSAMLLFSCTDTKKQEQTLLDEVIAIHDSVMAKEEQLVKAKIQLDTLLKNNTLPPADTAAAAKLIVTLDSTDARMEDWMHKFDAENKGKSHDEIMAYLEDQKKKIKAIDKDFDAAIATTNNYKKSLKK
ncbi:hypothetical protein [Mucilaginibacter pedocola]|uniref:Viral A-type inclusion protein n=1 Tax=Mucilaginibacter pedocola TaxID=1792845 RepID=A0A1S9PKZ1_9SPHI|nr:hypothetical protein [Mucilaginibacter pedocola]OOQ61636.1 hypothetical protein BC343_00740 [Mucilaginibacter pedocola]